MKKYIFGFLMLALTSSFSANAQYEEKWFEEMGEESWANLEALALYPEDIRKDILTTSVNADALIKLKSIQQKSSESFKALLADEDREVQEAIWDLSRYPNLINTLVTKKGKALNKALKEYPEVVHTRALEAHDFNFELLQEVNVLEQSTSQSTNRILDDYPAEVALALRNLIEYPEILTILTDDIELTMMAASLYKKRPEWVLEQADSLHNVLVEQQILEVDNWKKRLDEDPDAYNEMLTSARSFAEEYNYDDLYYDEEYDDDLYFDESEPETKVVEKHYYHHYPYWYGYPYWYNAPRWRPYPWYFEWGFYFGPGGTSIVFGLPSYFSLNWYFYHNYHHYYYPYFTSCVVNHYYGHRGQYSSISHNVNRWKSRNQAFVNDDWLSKEAGRVSRLREYGRFEKDRMEYNKQAEGKQLTRERFFEQNKTKYSKLAPPETITRKEGPKVKPRTGIQPKADAPVRNQKPKLDAPVRKQKPKTYNPSQKQKKPATRKKAPRAKVPTQKKSRVIVPKPKRQVPYRKSIPRVKRGIELHKYNWNKNSIRPPKMRISPRVKSLPRSKNDD